MKKSGIRKQASDALGALLAAADETDQRKGERHLQEALEHLSHAAGLVPVNRSLREHAAAVRHKGAGEAAELSLLERLGIDEEGEGVVDEHRLRERLVADTEKRGLLNTLYGESEAEILRELAD